MNNAGGLNKNLLVILNDNEMSICPRVGALARYSALEFSLVEETSGTVLASVFLPKHIEEKDPLLVRIAKGIYDPLLERALQIRWGIFAAAMVALTASSTTAPAAGYRLWTPTVTGPPTSTMPAVCSTPPSIR